MYMTSLAWQKASLLLTGNYPILSSLYADAELQRQIQDFAVYGEQFRYLVTRPQMINYAQTSDILQRHLHAALLRQISPRKAMETAAAEMNRATVTP
jgi:multiple sugar transport system substrate-binding protein